MEQEARPHPTHQHRHSTSHTRLYPGIAAHPRNIANTLPRDGHLHDVQESLSWHVYHQFRCTRNQWFPHGGSSHVHCTKRARPPSRRSNVLDQACRCPPLLRPDVLCTISADPYAVKRARAPPHTMSLFPCCISSSATASIPSCEWDKQHTHTQLIGTATAQVTGASFHELPHALARTRFIVTASCVTCKNGYRATRTRISVVHTTRVLP